MQNQQMSFSDTLGLGFMTFAFYLGAGNLIFPPFAGMLAGENMHPAMFGFLLTAVGMPLIGLIAVAKAKGKIMGLLPAAVATALAVAIYIIIGPAFAAPRTGLVAYEIGAKPFLDNTDMMFHIGSIALNQAQLVYTLVFFGITMLLALYPGKLLDSIGKVLTPVLMFLLAGLAISVFVGAGSAPMAPQGAYVDSPMVQGILEGYNTMDTLASLMFGILIIDILRKKGIESAELQTKYLVRAGIIAAIGLAFVYVSLFYLGATAGDIANGAKTGSVILTNYVNEMFGETGKVLLATVVTLACLTTSVGLVSACAEFFNELLPKLSYKLLVVLLSIICALVANVGLSELISISVPVLMMIYPIAIALVLVTFLTNIYKRPELSHRIVLATAFIFGIMDGVKATGWINVNNYTAAVSDNGFMQILNDMFAAIVHVYAKVPLQTEGMAWLLPTMIVMLACLLLPAKSNTVAAA
ncbi:branched-chain amino acid transport system II carrier protein [Shewanella marina]|uniref:branched-chain amino acid transport system II carrier protein n=1 Tax=Shewanella marina TaxID=487319 RepID=UPI000470A9E9|nr:branched-chain amino acid transport system II carrier protein [Shewanella marina]